MGCEDLGARAHALCERPLPEGARRAATLLLLEAAAAAAAASDDEIAEKILALSSRHGGTPVAPLIGRARRADAYFSALFAGTAARSSPAAPQFGALIATAGTRPVRGERALGAFAAGCEVALRLTATLTPRHPESGWDSSGTCGVIGAALTAILAAGGDVREVTHAIGIAACQTGGLLEAAGTLSGTLQAGRAASSGVLAALLAQRAFTGPERLDHEDGFFRNFPGADAAAVDGVSSGLGERWHLEEFARGRPPAQVRDRVRAAVEALYAANDASVLVGALCAAGVFS